MPTHLQERRDQIGRVLPVEIEERRHVPREEDIVLHEPDVVVPPRLVGPGSVLRPTRHW
jgi:hypothetical protein